MKTIALSIQLPELRSNFRDPQICHKYPGSGWLPPFATLCDQKGYRLLSADHACQEVNEKSLNPHDLFIIQEEFYPAGFQLIEQGARPQIVLSMESKLYAPDFYDQLPHFKKLFKHQLLFQGGTHPLRFPCYDLKELKRERPPWKDRKEVCMISSNKQYWFMSPRYDSPSWCEALRNELHSARLRAIEDYPRMDLYGHGWDRLDNIPPHWAHLKPHIQKIYQGPVKDKREILSQYQYAICFENISDRGYITEKMIDCLVTGTIPIYLGPKDWEAHIPPYLPDYSHEAFAEQIMGLIES